MARHRFRRCLPGRHAFALFLFALDRATAWREAHRWVIWLLPLAGGAVGWIYFKLGKQVEAGNNLLIDEIHDPKKVVPLRMVPLVLGGTVVSHLFGASVGREGTAVQMGGALADQLTHVFRLQAADRRILLMAGISAGFASVFGTPLAGPPLIARFPRRSADTTAAAEHDATRPSRGATLEKWILYAIVSMAFAGFTSVIAKLGLVGIRAILGWRCAPASSSPSS